VPWLLGNLSASLSLEPDGGEVKELAMVGRGGLVGEAEMSRIAQVNLEMQRPGRKEEIQERVRTAKLISQPTMRSWPSAWPSRRDTVVSGW
jgi:hypothetical protein